MKRTVFLKCLGAVVSAVTAVFLGGCVVPSLHPLYTDADLVTEPAIVGTWATKGGEETFKFFRKPGAKAYTMIYTWKENGVPARFDARLTRIGQGLYMDTIPQSMDEPPKSSPFSNILFACHFPPTHVLWRLEMKDGGLQLAVLDPDLLMKALEQKTVSVAHERLEGNEGQELTLVLTASTPALREFLLQSADKVFDPDPGTLRRKLPAGKASSPTAGKESGSQ